MRRFSRVPLMLATIMSMAAALVGVGAGSAGANYRPPSIHLLCTGTSHGSLCALPPGVTTAPNNYSATIAVSKTGAAGATSPC